MQVTSILFTEDMVNPRTTTKKTVIHTHTHTHTHTHNSNFIYKILIISQNLETPGFLLEYSYELSFKINSVHTYMLSARLRICSLYPFQRIKAPTKKGCYVYDTKMHLIVKLQLWNLGSVEYLFIASSPRFTLIQRGSTC